MSETDLDLEPEELAGLATFPGLDHPPFTGIEAMRWAVHLFEDLLGLPVPPLPAGFADAMRVLGPGVVGTREDAPGPYDPAWFLRELEEQPGADYLLAGHSGHGLNSWAIHYYLVQAPLALFVQIPWGGAHMDNDVAGARVGRAFAAAGALISTKRLDALPPGQHLVVIASDSADSSWGQIGLPGKGALKAMKGAADPLAAALASLAASPEPADLRPHGPIWG